MEKNISPDNKEKKIAAFHHAKIIDLITLKGGYSLLKLSNQELAGLASAGQFICFTESKGKFSLPLMRANPKDGELELLYKTQGQAANFFGKKKKGEKLALKVEVDEVFKVNSDKKRPLLIGSEIGMAAMVFLAEQLKDTEEGCSPLVLLASEQAYPFIAKPSQIMINGMPIGAIASMPLLEDWDIACRLSSKQGFPGCFDGSVVELAKQWLTTLEKEQLAEIEIFSCGTTNLQDEIVILANDFSLPFQQTPAIDS